MDADKQVKRKPEKTEYMIIGHPRRTIKLKSQNQIKRVAKTTSLGVMVDKGLNWDDQFSKMKGKISGGIKSLKN